MFDATASSGDLLADKRYQYGVALAAEGDHAAAADLFTQAVELAPGWAAGWFALGDAHARSGDMHGATEAFAQAALLDSGGILGAPLALAALDAGDLPSGADAAHVRALFDAYAPRFEAHLATALAYRAPELLCAALDSLAPSQKFARAIDLGCGTGLMGAAIRPRVRWLAGVDLSPKMVAQARGKALYDVLEVGDMVATLHRHAPLDLVTAADVLVYVGDLAPVFEAVAQSLAHDGKFAFSLQRSDDGRDVSVGADRRFAHSDAHVRQRATDAGLIVRVCEAASTRRDAGQDVPGLIAVLSRPSHFGRT